MGFAKISAFQCTGRQVMTYHGTFLENVRLSFTVLNPEYGVTCVMGTHPSERAHHASEALLQPSSMINRTLTLNVTVMRVQHTEA